MYNMDYGYAYWPYNVLALSKDTNNNDNNTTL